MAMVDVFMKDGKTVFRFNRRTAMVRCLTREPVELAGASSLLAWVRWQRHENQEWESVRIQHIAKSSIAFVVAVPADEAAEFLREQGVENKVAAAA